MAQILIDLCTSLMVVWATIGKNLLVTLPQTLPAAFTFNNLHATKKVFMSFCSYYCAMYDTSDWKMYVTEFRRI